MTTVPHCIIYEKPKIAISRGERTYLRTNAYQYTHRIAAIGGYDNASCTLDVPQYVGERIYTEFVGNRIAFYIDNPAFPVWEGFINRVTIEVGGLVTTRSMDEMGNAIYTTYWDTSSTPNTKLTALAFDAPSGAIWGFKTKVIDIGTQYSGGVAIANAQRNLTLANQKFPMVSSVPGGSNEFRITIDCLGFYHTLGWDAFDIPTGTNPVSTNVFWMLYDTSPTSPSSFAGFNSSRFPANGNGNGVFYNNLDFSLWTANTSFNCDRQKQMGQTHLQKLLSMVEPGDGVNRWVMGITPTDPNLGYRRAYYRQANTAVEYFTNVYGDRRIRNPAGGIVPPYEVIPDGTIVISDFLTTYNVQGEDPRVAYMSAVEYDGETNSVTWQTEDDLTLGGVFQLERQNRATDRRFGAPQRMVYY